MRTLPWWWPFVVAFLLSIVGIVLILTADASLNQRVGATASLLEVAGGGLLGVPLLKSGRRALDLATTSGPTTFGSFATTNDELRVDIVRSAQMGGSGLVLLLVGFTVQFVNQLWIG